MSVKAKILTPSQLADMSVTTHIGQNERWEFFERHYLAEGDSWFTLAALPGGNVLQEMHLERDSLIVNSAYPGDTLKHIVDWRRNIPFVNLLSKRNFAEKWTAVLLSGGGNDLIDAALATDGILRRPAGVPVTVDDCIDATNLAVFETYVRANMTAVVELRDAPGSPNRGIPIFMHTYDYPTARPAPARLFDLTGLSGPWLHRAYTAHGIPENLWIALTDHLIDRLATLLTSLNLPNLHVIDTRNTLTRAAPGSTGDSGDWLNEIHANRVGRRKIADKLAAAIDQAVG